MLLNAIEFDAHKGATEKFHGGYGFLRERTLMGARSLCREENSFLIH